MSGAPAVVGTDAVVVRLGAGRFAVELVSVAEVGRLPAVTRVPGMPAWLAGVVNWRGRVLPALDLRGLLGAPRVTLDGRARLLVVAAEGVSVGLVVEQVEGTAVLGGHVEAFPAALSATAADLLSGQVPQPDGPVAVLDVAAVVRLRAALPHAGRMG